MSVKVERLVKEYGSQRAVNELSFDIHEGEVVGLLGPNGAGKSTTMKILTCFIPQTSGTASVCGYDVNEHPLEVRKRIGYLPESNPLYFEMYVKEYLTYTAGFYNIANKSARVKEMIEMVGLGKEQNKRIGQLSKGYKQRVGLAQAIIHDPEVLILDEPTSGLDPNQIVEIRNLVNEIGKKKTVILSTHIMQEVEAMCKRVLILKNGNLIADQPIDQIQKSDNHVVLVVSFEKEVNRKQLQSINGVAKVTQNHKEWFIEAKPGVNIQKEVFEFAVSTGNTVLQMTQHQQSLEDVFRNLTK